MGDKNILNNQGWLMGVPEKPTSIVGILLEAGKGLWNIFDSNWVDWPTETVESDKTTQSFPNRREAWWVSSAASQRGCKCRAPCDRCTCFNMRPSSHCIWRFNCVCLCLFGFSQKPISGNRSVSFTMKVRRANIWVRLSWRVLLDFLFSLRTSSYT